MTTSNHCTECGHDRIPIYTDRHKVPRLALHTRHGTRTTDWRRACIGSETSAEYINLVTIEPRRRGLEIP